MPLSVGILIGAVQGYFGGWTDLGLQRFTEIWNALAVAIPADHPVGDLCRPIPLLMAIFALFGWISLADYVRAEFLRNRGLEFVKGARAMGLSSSRIMWRHILPNSLTPVITFLPFRLSEGLLALTSLDFLGLGVPGSVPSLGDLLRQGKNNLDAWWLSIPTMVATRRHTRCSSRSSATRCATPTTPANHDSHQCRSLRHYFRLSTSRSPSGRSGSWTISPSRSSQVRRSAWSGSSGSGKSVTALSVL